MHGAKACVSCKTQEIRCIFALRQKNIIITFLCGVLGAAVHLNESCCDCRLVRAAADLVHPSSKYKQMMLKFTASNTTWSTNKNEA
jgi:hypothetical protein